jgi:AhpD family alkylhydroperoxidase
MTHPVFLFPEARTAMLDFHALAENLPPRLRNLLQLRASQINGCSVCVEMHAAELEHDGVPGAHIFAVAAWRDAPYFSDAERAVLELTEVLTRLADKGDAVPDAVWAQVSAHFSEEEIAAILISIAGINVWNRLNAAIRQPSGIKWDKAA